MEDEDITNYPDDTTPYVSVKTSEEVLNILEDVSSTYPNGLLIKKWKKIQAKCHLLIL